MAEDRHLDVTELGDVTVVRFRDEQIAEHAVVEEVAGELLQLLEVDDFLLDLSAVRFVSGSFFSKLITLARKMKDHGRVLKLTKLRPEMREVLAITKLNQLFDIDDDEAEAS